MASLVTLPGKFDRNFSVWIILEEGRKKVMTNAPKQPNPAGWKLVLDNGSAEGKVFAVNQAETIIGRDPAADISLDDARISRHHARLVRKGDLLLIEDLNSFNGTLVNNQPVTGQFLVTPYDVITVGPFIFNVEGPTGSVPEEPVQALPVQAIPAAVTPPRPVVAARRPKAGLLLLGALALALITIVFLGGLAVIWMLAADNDPAEPPVASRPTRLVTKPPTIVVHQAPFTNSVVWLGQPVTVQASATDPTGVTRLELWANGRKYDELASQFPQGSASLTATWEWLPPGTGEFYLEIRAYNQPGLVGILPATTLQVETAPEPTATLEPTATPFVTFTPLPSPTPTATLSAATATSTLPPVTATPGAALYTLTAPGLNVRAGPGGDYDTIGLLSQGSRVEIVGQGEVNEGLWWQIRFDEAPDGLGWITSADGFGIATNTESVPWVTPAARPVVIPATPQPTATATAAAAAPPGFIQAPPGRTLLIVSNRSLANHPARLTLTEGKSINGAQEIEAIPGQDVEVVLEPDFYQAFWSSPARDNFTRGADFTAGKDQVVVMWIKPEDGLTQTEVYSRLPRSGTYPTPVPTATPKPFLSGYEAPPGKALLVVLNLSLENEMGQVTVSGGSFGGGQEIKLDPDTELTLVMDPANDYRTVWTSAAEGGVTAGREFAASAGEVILGWIVPEDREVFMQFPGQAPERISN